MEKQSVSVTDIGTALQITPSSAWRILRRRLGWYPYKPRSVVPLSNHHKDTRVVFCTFVSGTFVIAPEPALPKSAANLKEGSTDWEWTGMEISEMFYEMSKPNNEKYIIVFKYFCSFIGLRFNLKKSFQQKDSVYYKKHCTIQFSFFN